MNAANIRGRTAGMKSNVEDICPDINKWPESWQGFPEDIPYGKALLQEMIPFMKYLIDQGWAKKTIRNHMDNLWVLGGELIRRINDNESLRGIDPLELLHEKLDADGGPYCWHLDSESECRSYDSTCRKFFKFLCLEKDAGETRGKR